MGCVGYKRMALVSSNVCSAVLPSGGQGQVAGRVWPGGGGPGLVAGRAGRVGWLAGSGGGAGWLKGMDLQSKDLSGVNIITWYVGRISNQSCRIFDFTLVMCILTQDKNVIL